MRAFAFFILLFCFAIGAIGQNQAIPIGLDYHDSGFTNKAEAKNLMVNGLKEGKWVEYTDVYMAFDITTDTNANYYYLTFYKAGKPHGVKRYYSKNRKLISEATYKNGLLNGHMKVYFENVYKVNGEKTIQREIPFKDGKVNGIEREYFDNGNIESEYSYVDDTTNALAKTYFETGKLKSETQYNKGVAGTTKFYDENGNEIK